jgi:hypothetical protein
MNATAEGIELVALTADALFPVTIDPLVVLRSARALPRYGPDFRYAHHARFGTLGGYVGQLRRADRLAKSDHSLDEVVVRGLVGFVQLSEKRVIGQERPTRHALMEVVRSELCKTECSS